MRTRTLNTLADRMPTGPDSKFNYAELLALHKHLCDMGFAKWATTPVLNKETGRKEKPSSKAVLDKLTQIAKEQLDANRLTPTYLRKLRNAFTQTNEYIYHVDYQNWLRSLPRRMELEAGTWVLTDPCYVVETGEWGNFLNQTFPPRYNWGQYLTPFDVRYRRLGCYMRPIPGTHDEFGIPDCECTAVVFSTQNGDGAYYGKTCDGKGNSIGTHICGVDAGLIGLVRKEFCSESEENYETLIGVEFTSDAQVTVTYYITHLEIEYYRDGKWYTIKQAL